MIYLIHFSLALFLFIIQNWIGDRAYSKGYIRFSLLDEKDEAHSLNFVIKVFGPIVYLILIVAALQYLKIESYNKDIINVIYYYLFFRLFVIFLYERLRIVNWVRIISYYLTILLVANIVYDKFINSVGDLLPDFSQLKNEIWLLIIVFVYQLGNGITESLPENELQEQSRAFLPELKPRKRKYILRKYKQFVNKYGAQIKNNPIQNPNINIVIYSILIYENFNRPRFIRFLERIWVRIVKRKVSQGIMQIGSSIPITDEQSIVLGIESFNKLLADFNMEDFDNVYLRSLIKLHCPDRKYIRQILFIAKAIVENEETPEKYKELNLEIWQEFDLYIFP